MGLAQATFENPQLGDQRLNLFTDVDLLELLSLLLVQKARGDFRAHLYRIKRDLLQEDPSVSRAVAKNIIVDVYDQGIVAPIREKLLEVIKKIDGRMKRNLKIKAEDSPFKLYMRGCLGIPIDNAE